MIRRRAGRFLPPFFALLVFPPASERKFPFNGGAEIFAGADPARREKMSTKTWGCTEPEIGLSAAVKNDSSYKWGRGMEWKSSLAENLPPDKRDEYNTIGAGRRDCHRRGGGRCSVLGAVMLITAFRI